MSRFPTLLALALVSGGCPPGGEPDPVAPRTLTAVTFNTGTTAGLGHDQGPDDGYSEVDAAVSDAWYGDGLAWSAAVEDVRTWFAETPADIVAFQEVFYSGECPQIPGEAWPGFVCESWRDGDPTVAQEALGEGWQVACHQGKPDKCLAVRRAFGELAGCDEGLCLDGLDGGTVPGCGSGSRIGRGTIELVDGGTLTVVNVHGSSGLSPDDKDCRLAQFGQVWVDLGDGEPAANGPRNLVLGDFNTDPGRFLGTDPSAAFVADTVASGDFEFHTAVGPEAVRTYGGIANIDHVLSDAFVGGCWTAGIDAGHPAVSTIRYFDHAPAVCTLAER
jgi:hypothetical protein